MNKKSVIFAVVLTVAALVAAPFFAGCFVAGDVGDMPFNPPDFVRIAAPFVYLAGFTAVCAILGAKGKKKAGLAVVIILAVSFLLSRGVVALIFNGSSDSHPVILNIIGLIAMYLSIPASSLVEGFAGAIDAGICLPVCAVVLTPFVSAAALTIGLLKERKKTNERK